MSESQVVVVAKLLAKAGKEAELRQLLLGLIEPTRSEQGCVVYDLHESTEQPGLFMFYEVWRQKADLQAHLERPHLKNLFAKAEALLAQPPEISLWRRVA